jgi:hemerythrin
MSRIIWDDSLQIGIQVIDYQHKKIADLYNKLVDALVDSKPKELINLIIKEFMEYALTHFETEENMFKLANYVDTKSHIEQHQKFQKKAREMINGFHTGKIVLSETTLHFVQLWITDHIKTSDMAYYNSLRRAGFK